MTTKLEWLVATDNNLLVRIHGEDFTVAKYLQTSLLDNPGVVFASCDVQPAAVTLCVRTSHGTYAKAAVLTALRAMREKCDHFNELCDANIPAYGDTPGYHKPLKGPTQPEHGN